MSNILFNRRGELPHLLRSAESKSDESKSDESNERWIER